MAITMSPKPAPTPSSEQVDQPTPNIISVPLDSVQPNDWNPNEMDAATFTELANDIRAQGNDQPIIVRPLKDEQGVATGRYEIVDGEHRFRSAKLAGHANVLVSVKSDWTDTDAQINTLRRNSLRGNNNPAKFTALVQKISQSGMDYEAVRARSAIPLKDFQRVFKGMTAEKQSDAKKADEAVADQSAKTFAVSGLSQMVRDLVEKHGDTIPQGYVAFTFRGQSHLMVSMDKSLLRVVSQLRAIGAGDGLPESTFAKALTKSLAAVVAELESTGEVSDTSDVPHVNESFSEE